MNINVDLGEFLKHLSFWHNKTDEECVEMTTSECGGIDAEQALLNMLERDFCTAINNNAVKELMKTLN